MNLPLAPLDPSPDSARSLLRRELVRPEYHERDLLGRLARWLGRALDASVSAASALPPLATAAAMLVLALLAVGLGLLASRARRDRSPRRGGPSVLPERPTTAGELRARATAALAAGHTTTAFLDGYRALALRQVEQGLLPDHPGTTAHEVAVALAEQQPAHATRLARDAELFDAVRYGHRSATEEQARAVLDLDHDLAALR